MSDVTRILSQIEQGDPQAASQLLPLVYDELRKLAAAKLAHEKPGQTLQATALVHEAYLRLVKPASEGREAPGTSISDSRSPTPDSSSLTSDLRPLTSGRWNSRGHFFGAAAEAIRRILIENARRKSGPEAGGDYSRVELSSAVAQAPERDFDILALSESLDRLEAKDARAAQLVKLRFFAGLTRQQAADALGISIATADNDWAYAKGWLKAELAGKAGSQ
jgi:DNA-directed RNA polymerase specialized sigma24 family protein